jgi:hypothetical protein
MNCHWEVPFGGKSEWFKLLPNARVTSVRTYSLPPQGDRIGRALRICGALEEMNIVLGGARKVRELDAFLAAVGRQPALKLLRIRSEKRRDESLDPAWSDHEFGQRLRQFPRLEVLELTSVPYSGVNFPPLAALQEFITRDCPVSDAGLAEILRAPALRKAWIRQPAATTPEAVRQVTRHRQPALQELSLFVNGQKAGDDWMLEEMVRQACPDLHCVVYFSLDDLIRAAELRGEAVEVEKTVLPPSGDFWTSPPMLGPVQSLVEDEFSRHYREALGL